MNYCPFLYYYYTILHGVGTIITILQLFTAIDIYMIAYISVFVDDGIFDHTSVAYAHDR